MSSSHDRTTHPSSSGLKPVVVVAVQGADGGIAVLRLELDDPHPSEVGTDTVDVLTHGGRDVGVRRPQGVLVGLALVPEPAAVELSVGGRDRGEVGVAAALPVHVLERLVLGLRHDERGVGQDHDAPVGELRAGGSESLSSGIFTLQ